MIVYDVISDRFKAGAVGKHRIRSRAVSSERHAP